MLESFFRLIRWIAWLLLLIVAVVLSTANRGEVSLSLFPLPWEINTPLFILLILSIGIGFLWGKLIAKLETMQLRRDARNQQRKIDSLQSSNAALEAENRQYHLSGQPKSEPQLISQTNGRR